MGKSCCISEIKHLVKKHVICPRCTKCVSNGKVKALRINKDFFWSLWWDGQKVLGGKDSLRAFFCCRNGQVETVLCFLDDDVWGRNCFFFFHFLVKLWSGVANRLQCVHSNRMQPWQKAFFRRKKTDSFRQALTVKRADAGKILRLRLKERRELWWYGMMGIWNLWIFHIWLLDLWVQLASKRVTSLACFVSPLEGDHNISCDHEVEKDQHGTSRHYLVLRTSSAIFRNGGSWFDIAPLTQKASGF